MDLSNEFSCEAGSFSHHLNPHWFLEPEVLRLYFLALESWVAWYVLLPRCSSQFIHAQMWDHSVCWLCQPPPCGESSPPRLPNSAPPTGLDECFFFNSLVVRLPYSLIFWQFWLVLFLNLLSFLWLCKEAQCIYLCLHLGRM